MSALLAACSRRTDSFSSEEEVFSVFYSCAGRRCTRENRIRFPNMEHVCTLKRSKAFTNTWPGFACTPRQQQLLVQWKRSGCSLLAAADPPRVWQTFSLQRSFQALPKCSANFTNNSWFGFSEQSACLYFYTALWVRLSAFNMNYSEQTEAEQRASIQLKVSIGQLHPGERLQSSSRLHCGLYSFTFCPSSISSSRWLIKALVQQTEAESAAESCPSLV